MIRVNPRFLLPHPSLARRPRSSRLPGGGRPRGCALSTGRRARMFRERLPRGSGVTFALQRLLCGGGLPRRSPLRPAIFSALKIPLGLPASFIGSLAVPRRRQLHSGAARFGKADRDGLFRGSGAVFSLTDMLDFFAHKFARLRRRRFAFALFLAGPRDGFIFWHIKPVRAPGDARRGPLAPARLKIM